MARMKKAVIAIAVLTLPLFAQPAPKNVQLLKDLTPTQLQRTMNFMRASLGVHCDYCHVNDEKTGWDWASDAKPEKVTGRKMIQLTMDMNAKYFEGHNDVTCNTCHRGAIRPVALPVLPQPQPPFPTPKAERPKLPTRDEIVAKFAKATGNVDHAALSSMTMKGTRESANGQKADIDVTFNNGRYAIVGPEVTNVLTPDAGWITDKKETRAMSLGQIEHGYELNNAMLFVAPQDIPADARVTRKDKIDGRDVYVVQYRIDPKVRQRLYFDAESGLLVRRMILRTTQIADVPLQTDYSDYRDAGPYKLPYTVRLDSVDPWIGSTRRFTEIHPGARVDEGVFGKPK